MFITARVRSTREGNSFTLLVCSRGGQVQPAGGGSGPASRGVGVRSSRGGGGSGPAGGVRSVQLVGGVSQWGGVSPAGGGGGQHLAPSCGRYASCVHAGGLSCFN